MVNASLIFSRLISSSASRVWVLGHSRILFQPFRALTPSGFHQFSCTTSPWGPVQNFLALKHSCNHLCWSTLHVSFTLLFRKVPHYLFFVIQCSTDDESVQYYSFRGSKPRRFFTHLARHTPVQHGSSSSWWVVTPFSGVILNLANNFKIPLIYLSILRILWLHRAPLAHHKTHV